MAGAIFDCVADSKGFLPLISPFLPLGAVSEGFIPLIPPFRPLGADSEGTIIIKKSPPQLPLHEGLFFVNYSVDKTA